MINNTDKCQNVAHWLNHQASMSKANHKHKQFTPCAKASVFIASPNKPLMEVIQEAVNTPCLCHNNVTSEDLLDYCFDDRAKKAHYTQGIPC